ncbi:hypothetical protein MR626_05865 [bacterium]|nr:hypothetical protein [bacterium]
MKKAIGWILVIVGGFFCVVGVLCVPVAFTADNIPFGERIAVLVSFLAIAAVNGLICRLGFRLKSAKKDTRKQKTVDQWMTSQLPALYLQKNKTVYRNQYIGRLESIGFQREDAKKIFDFECEVIRKFPKPYLLQPQFTKMWFFGLKQPFFRQYPKTKEDILKERYLTVSELCKIIDEAEWHFWNSHERELPDGVWQEICEWRLKGPGAEFAIRYFGMIEKATGIPEGSLAELSSEQGRHLSQYKWR